MFFDRFMRLRDITLLADIFSIARATFGVISPRTHRAILQHFRQDCYVKSIKKHLVLVALISLFTLPLSMTPTLAKSPAPIPSPQPKWPPIGFKGVDGVFAKIPTKGELVGLLSAKTTLQAIVKQCKTVSCGAVVVASTNGCLWWEVNSSVYLVGLFNTKAKLGSLTTFENGTGPKEQKTIFLISGEKYDRSISVSRINVLCHRTTSDQQKPGNVYHKVESANS
jgi:hypothetical protein